MFYTNKCSTMNCLQSTYSDEPNFKEHVLKGTPISDCFQMKMVLRFSSSLRNSWHMLLQVLCKISEKFKTISRISEKGVWRPSLEG